MSIPAPIKIIVGALAGVALGGLLNLSANEISPAYAPFIVRWGWSIGFCSFTWYVLNLFGAWTRIHFSWLQTSNRPRWAASIFTITVLYVGVVYWGVNKVWDKIVIPRTAVTAATVPKTVAPQAAPAPTPPKSMSPPSNLSPYKLPQVLTPANDPVPPFPDWFIQQRAFFRKRFGPFGPTPPGQPIDPIFADDKEFEDLQNDSVRIIMGESFGFITKDSQRIITIADIDLLTCFRVKGGISISAKIFDDEDNPVVELDHNKMLPSYNRIWGFGPDMPDGHSIIVYDNRRRTVLSVRYVNPRVITVLGVFSHKKRQIIVDQQSMSVDGIPNRGNFFGSVGGSFFNVQ